MTDDGDIREYMARRLHEARTIRTDADAKVRELEEVLDGGDPDALDPIRLDAWLDRRRLLLAHMDVELCVLAGAPIGTPWWARWLRAFQKRLA